jgi:3'-phosphoadenosine 5'-phosphosulfate sulfotransferase (PAPS reductase)/FAD synthetase
MTIHEYKPGDIVLFCDTGREHEKTYKFIHDFEAHEGIPVIWLKNPIGFEGVIKKESMIPNHGKENVQFS